ncbi:hypothetical protein [uncultured Nitrospira sp.]|uniref:hypothetical protein n=1 Tax=uncultured Nitrospira sp. TaxID=157176 RepID=UPI003140A2ED
MSERKNRQNIVMPEGISFLPPIQVGYEIYYENIEIQGIQDRQTIVWQFIQGSNHLLDWEQEPSNPQNPHAIKIFGVSEQIFSTKRDMLGYVPDDVAKQIVTSGLWPFLQLRLDHISVANQGFIAVRFQILGPIRKKNDDEKTLAGPGIKGEHRNTRSTRPTLLFDRESDRPKAPRSKVKQIAFFIIRVIVITLGTALAFVGGTMGTAAWQARGNLFVLMLVPLALIISGGLLIWTGIKPSNSKGKSPT